MSQAIKHSFFYVGGRYIEESPGKQLMAGQMYVEVLTPTNVTRKYPLVMIHGTAQTGTNWIQTPDGRPGWAHYFASLGYVVYVVDQPSRGRSAWHPGLDGTLGDIPVAAVERYFTACSQLGEWPQARRHSQWPGSGRQGDPVFDAFFAAQVDYVTDSAETQNLFQEAGAALLDHIGTAILITHSQSGPFGWLLADTRPGAVRAIVALEPQGPPVYNLSLQRAMKGQQQVPEASLPRIGGIADIPLAYEPALAPGESLAFTVQDSSGHVERIPCWRQQEPARQLVHLKNVPVLIVTGEASFHAIYDHGTHDYLVQAGVPSTHWRLEEFGLLGNGHMLMLEKNSLAIAEKVEEWLSPF